MSSEASWEVVQLLAEPTRRELYAIVRASDTPLTRDDVAERAGIGRTLAAFHLDRLADAGLLATDYARTAGRSGPGAGRPAKRYRPGNVHVAMTLPPRRNDVAARIFATAVARAPKSSDREAMTVAREEGERIGEWHRPSRTRGKAAVRAASEDALATLGYEPARGDDGRTRLRNCPFRDVVDVSPALVCGLNHALVCGVLDGTGAAGRLDARLDGTAPDCCVTVGEAEPKTERRSL